MATESDTMLDIKLEVHYFHSDYMWALKWLRKSMKHVVLYYTVGCLCKLIINRSLYQAMNFLKTQGWNRKQILGKMRQMTEGTYNARELNRLYRKIC